MEPENNNEPMQDNQPMNMGVDPGMEENYISAPVRPDLTFSSSDEAMSYPDSPVVQPGAPDVPQVDASQQYEPQQYMQPETPQVSMQPDMNMMANQPAGQEMPSQMQQPMMQQSMPGQPMMNQPMQPMQPMPAPQSSQPESKKGGNSIKIVIPTVLVILVIAIVVFVLAMNGTLFGGNSTPTPTPAPAPILTPNPEVAQDVCEERGGTFITADLSESSMSEAIEAYSCAYKYSLEIPNPDGFEFTFLVFDRNFTEIESISLDGLPESSTILENSADLIKVYGTTTIGDTGTSNHNFEVAYDNTYIDLSAFDIDIAEEILTDLGYPEPAPTEPEE